MEETSEDLLTKLDQYREQLAQVESGLEENPEEPQLLKLRNDLREVIALTEDLQKYQAATEQDARPGASAAVGTEQRSAAAKIIGRTCEVFYEDGTTKKWYNAIIKSVRKDSRGIDRCTVELIGFQNTREYRFSEVRLVKPPHPAQCGPGTKCQAIFEEDGLWYDCVVKEQTEKGYRVLFTDYGNDEEVNFDQVRLGQSKQAEKKANVKEYVTPAGYRIPENLKIDPADSQKQKALKRRKIREIKAEQRKKMMDQDHLKVQNNWQKFMATQASTRSKSGFLTGKPKESIFKSPETLDGKVGVTNSGSKMTNFAERTKFSYNFT
mmetsp:Transcript_57893/g.154698  ORF Transcript_57893/g.154698 Transcript_57893/m.154698 type:complete len:323 (+) Transcript_57893:107-1075(+)